MTTKKKNKQIKFKPVGAYILLQPIEEETNMNKYGIVTESNNDHVKAKVIKIGTGVTFPNGERTKFNVKEGDIVLMKNFSYLPIQLEGEKYIIAYEADILMKVRK